MVHSGGNNNGGGNNRVVVPVFEDSASPFSLNESDHLGSNYNTWS